MTHPLARQLWPACHSALHLDRFLAGELDAAASDSLRAHLSGCARCSAALDELRPREALPPLRVAPLARPRWKGRALAGAAGLAAAASVLLVLRPRPIEHSKGPGFAVAAYVQHGSDVRRASPGEIVSPGDALRFAVSAPAPGYVAVLSVDPQGRASIYYPAGERAAVTNGTGEVALPLATRLDATVGEERITALFCDSAIELGAVRSALESGNFRVPAGCQVARWNFVKR